MLREAALLIGHTLSTLAPGLCRQSPVLREAALLVRYRLATHARYLPLPLRVHRCEPTVRYAPFMNCSMSHHCSPYVREARGMPDPRLCSRRVTPSSGAYPSQQARIKVRSRDVRSGCCNSLV